MKPSLQVIADKLGVSTASVSRALNDRKGVSNEVREQILQVAHDIGYVPNTIARSLATSRTQTLGVIAYARQSQSPIASFPDEMMQGIDEEARSRGYHIMNTYVDDEMMTHINNVPLLREQRIDGVMLIGPPIKSSFVVQLLSSNMPVILVGNVLEETTVDSIVSDNAQGTYDLTRHLISVHGLRNIVFLCGPADWLSNKERYQAYEEAMAQNNAEPRVVYMPDTTIHTGYAALPEALERYPDTEAIVAVNDATAFGVIRACKERGLQVPEDIAVVGFDNVGWAAHHDPPLTTVRTFQREMGVHAAKYLIDRIERDMSPNVQLRLGVELVLRRSCGCQP